MGKNALHLCVNFRSCKPEPVMTGSGLIWLDEMADLMMLNAPIKRVLINRRMPMTLLSEGWMTLHCGWTTVRGSFGTIVCDSTGQKDLCYREGAISYMPQSMMCCQHENVSQPTPSGSPAAASKPKRRNPRRSCCGVVASADPPRIVCLDSGCHWW